MPSAYLYVVDRDFGFAPNPFHSMCTLATCKPIIRRVAEVGSWVIGMGGRRLTATGRCVFAMRISEAVTFQHYWDDPRFSDKKPVRNGSRKMMVGDNIYSKASGEWVQANSHHSHADGTPNQHNVSNDTQTDRVLLSDHFFYFGELAPVVPAAILNKLGYTNGRNHRTFSLAEAGPLLQFLSDRFPKNQVIGDPIDFENSAARYSVHTNKIHA